MEAARELYNVNMIPKERTVMEAHQRYLDIQNGQRAYYEDVLAEKDNALAEKDNALMEKDNALLEKEEEIARLRAQIELLGRK